MADGREETINNYVLSKILFYPFELVDIALQKVTVTQSFKSSFYPQDVVSFQNAISKCQNKIQTEDWVQNAD